MLKINYCVIKTATRSFSWKECFRGLEAYEFNMCCLELADQRPLVSFENNIIALLSLYVIFASNVPALLEKSKTRQVMCRPVQCY